MLAYDIVGTLDDPYQEINARPDTWKRHVLDTLQLPTDNFEDVIPNREWFDKSEEIVNNDYIINMLLGFSDPLAWEFVSAYLYDSVTPDDVESGLGVPLDELQCLVDDADYTFSSAPRIDKSIRVMHGVAMNHDVQIGDLITFKQYLSTTLDPAMVADCSGGDVFMIDLHPGSQCIYVHEGETNIMLPRNHVVRIRDITTETIEGQIKRVYWC